MVGNALSDLNVALPRCALSLLKDIVMLSGRVAIVEARPGAVAVAVVLFIPINIIYTKIELSIHASISTPKPAVKVVNNF